MMVGGNPNYRNFMKGFEILDENDDNQDLI